MTVSNGAPSAPGTVGGKLHSSTMLTGGTWACFWLTCFSCTTYMLVLSVRLRPTLLSVIDTGMVILVSSESAPTISHTFSTPVVLNLSSSSVA
jgi:hypothetical protein